MNGSGLRDKLYWRRTRRGWHCYKRRRAPGGHRAWAPLCGAPFELARSDGQDSRRPPSPLRCPRCDGAEMTRRGWDEGGPDHLDLSQAADCGMLDIRVTTPPHPTGGPRA